MNWQNIILLLIGALFGFLLKILYGKLFEKKVNLSYKVEKPAFFSLIKPPVCFQNIRIWNKGNLPAKGIRINLDREIIDNYKAMYESNYEENYEKEETDKVCTLKFTKILPQDDLIVSFKTEKPLPENFLISIKSEEMIARNYVTEKTSRAVWLEPVIWIIGAAFVFLAIVGGANLFHLKSETKTTETKTILKQDSRVPFSIAVTTDKNIYTAGQKMEINFLLRNKSDEILSDITTVPTLNLQNSITH